MVVSNLALFAFGIGSFVLTEALFTGLDAMFCSRSKPKNEKRLEDAEKKIEEMRVCIERLQQGYQHDLLEILREAFPAST